MPTKYASVIQSVSWAIAATSWSSRYMPEVAGSVAITRSDVAAGRHGLARGQRRVRERRPRLVPRPREGAREVGGGGPPQLDSGVAPWLHAARGSPSHRFARQTPVTYASAPSTTRLLR